MIEHTALRFVGQYIGLAMRWQSQSSYYLFEWASFNPQICTGNVRFALQRQEVR